MKRLPIFLLIAVATWFGMIRPGSACAICLGMWGQPKTLAEEIMAADSVALAASRDGVDFKVWRVLKGDDDKLTDQRFKLKDGEAGAQILVARDNHKSAWRSIGILDASLRPFLEKVIPLRTIDVAPDRVWHEYLDLFLEDLGHEDERIAKSAWQLWAKAPFRILVQRKEHPPLQSLRTWLANDTNSYSKSLWIILLGAHGEEEDHEWIKSSLQTAWDTNSIQFLPALITARLLLENESAISWIDAKFLRDRDRTLLEIQAAVAALGVVGQNNPKLQPAVTKAFLALLEHRRPLSGLVATDLAAWKVWEAAPQYRKMLSSGEPVLPQTRRAITDYLAAHDQRSPPPLPTP